MREKLMMRTIDDAREAARTYAAEHFPNALAVLLAGSWAAGTAHVDSDLDVVIIDETVDRVQFEGAQYREWVVEVCTINPAYAEFFFGECAAHRSAPIPYQVSHSELIAGDPEVAGRVGKLADHALERGAEPVSEADRLETRYDLTPLRQDLIHASAETLPALAAYAHVELSRASLDAARRWRAERKALRTALVESDPDLALHLDDALADAVNGDPSRMVEACNSVLFVLGGPLRTYERFTA